MNRFVVKSISVLAVAPFPVPVTVAFPEEEEVMLISTSPDESVVPEEAPNVPRSVEKSIVSGAPNWPADTNNTVKISKTPGGALRMFWDSSWITTTSGAGTGIQAASQTTSYLCSSNTAPADCWVKSLKFFRRLRK